MTQILAVLGTRPEAIKLFPVVHALRAAGVDSRLCLTGQHGAIADRVLEQVGIIPDERIAANPRDASLDTLFGHCLLSVGEVIDRSRPQWVMVQGDTSSAAGAAIAAFHRRIPIAHVEAGLRSGSLADPWPEEGNRRMIAALAAQHFAPTERAGAVLRQEGVDPGGVHVVGNTVIDALMRMRERIASGQVTAPTAARLLAAAGTRRVLLVTAHRRETWGKALDDIIAAIAQLAGRGDTAVIWPVHPNPIVAGPVTAALSGMPHVHLTNPLDYPDLVAILSAAWLVLTDSGGLQEEAPAFGVPVLVLRDVTERPEGVGAGTAQLIGTNRDRIVRETSLLLDDSSARARMAQVALPYGDGHAAQRIATIMAEILHPPAR